MSRVTGLQRIDNALETPIKFENGENSGNNRTIPARANTGVGNCWIPWREDNNVNMDVKRLTITLSPQKVYYVWQHDDHIRYSLNSDPGTADGGSIIPGESYRGSSKVLAVNEMEEIALEQA